MGPGREGGSSPGSGCAETSPAGPPSDKKGGLGTVEGIEGDKFGLP